MKKFMSITLLALLVTCMFVACAPTTVAQAAEPETQYYAAEFNGASEFVTKSFTVPFESRNSSSKAVAIRTPHYVLGGITCVPNATINLLAYYDRFYEDLIPNHTPGYMYGDYYLYSTTTDEYVTAAITQFIEDMGLIKSDGATVNQFKSGMTKYCKRLSLSANYTSVMKSGKINYETVTKQILAGKPIIIFCSNFNLAVIATDTNQDVVTLYTSSDAHAMTVFGFTEITYTMTDGTTRTDKYLRVATGVSTMKEATMYLSSNVVIDDAYALSIS